MQFKHIGYDVIIYPKAKIICPEEISIGNNVIIDDFVFLYGKGGVTIGDFVHISSFVSITGNSGLVLEDFASLSPGVRVLTGNDDYSGIWMVNSTIPDKFRGATRKAIHIEKYVVVGTNSVILPGIHIGEGVAVGANSLVNKDCIPWTIYAGTPAKPIKDRIRDRIPKLEKELRKEVYDKNGNYIPKDLRN